MPNFVPINYDMENDNKPRKWNKTGLSYEDLGLIPGVSRPKHEPVAWSEERKRMAWEDFKAKHKEFFDELDKLKNGNQKRGME